jgi:PadR family transcriptional regulator PadR
MTGQLAFALAALAVVGVSGGSLKASAPLPTGCRPKLERLNCLGMRGDQLRGHLDALVLAVLAAGPAHGYSVIVRLRERSRGGFDLPEGTIYPALHRLEAAGLLSARFDEVQGRRRKVYALTTAGQRELAEQRSQWHRFSSLVTTVIGAPA